VTITGSVNAHNEQTTNYQEKDEKILTIGYKRKKKLMVFMGK
jgi:hypothetical protein